MYSVYEGSDTVQWKLIIMTIHNILKRLPLFYTHYSPREVYINLKMKQQRSLVISVDTEKLKCYASLITVNIQSLSMYTTVEIIMCMILIIKQYDGCVV